MGTTQGFKMPSRREEIIVPVDKPFITLSGLKANSTIITSSGGGTIWYATVSILASNFVGRYLTIQNMYGPGAQAVALRVTGDQAAFYACRIIGYQDTLFDHSGRHYYSNCYIEGATDFIFGDGLSIFEKCRIHSVSKKGGAITAQRRSSPTDNTGYSFINCKITGRGSTILGRPWGPYSRVVFAYTYMSRVVAPQGWNDWGNPLNQKTAFYGQYKCYGPGSSLSKRARWARALSYEEAAPFLTHFMIDGQQWLRPMPSIFKRP
ncbi:putative pectinesterase 11 [Acorus calamus]|uniref:Pectinesterase n=1 Tax=Acorus calamus TaxID=4465 RepID=A0AAV9FMP2_ACOCL|nr:putative pectinesterase 11 [Acorus calamus]